MRLARASVQNQADLADLINLIKDLKGLDDPGNAISADANVGLGIRYGHFALGARTYAQATGRVIEIDTENLGLSGSTDLNAEIESVATSDFDGEISLLTDSQVELLRAAGLSDTAIQNIDYVARQEGISSSEIEGVVDLMADLVDQTVSGSGGDLEGQQHDRPSQGVRPGGGSAFLRFCPERPLGRGRQPQIDDCPGIRKSDCRF